LPGKIVIFFVEAAPPGTLFEAREVPPGEREKEKERKREREKEGGKREREGDNLDEGSV